MLRKGKKHYTLGRSATAVKAKAAHAFGRKTDVESTETGDAPVTVAAERPLASGEVRKDPAAPPPKIEPLSLEQPDRLPNAQWGITPRPVGTHGFDKDAGYDRLRQQGLATPTSEEVLSRAAVDHDFDDAVAKVWMALVRHNRGLNAKGVDPGWAQVTLSESTLAPMAGGVQALELGLQILESRGFWRVLAPGSIGFVKIC